MKVFSACTLSKCVVIFVQDNSEPVMCSYKAIKVFFEVWGLQGKVESGVHRVSQRCTHTHTHTHLES